MIKPELTQVRDKNSLTDNACAYYIGRGTKWGNPYKVSKYGRKQCIVKYEQYLKNNRDLLSSLCELSGKTLICHCYPEECHGDIIIKHFSKEFLE